MVELAERVEQLQQRALEKRRSARQAIVERDAENAAKQDEQRAVLRESMPEVAGLVDAFRAVFGGDQVRVLAAQENGKTVISKRAMQRACCDVRRYEQ